jgi:signal transduction histidine kinase
MLVERERAFAAHAAHTLRTPLAGMDAQLAAAIQESPPLGLPRLRRVRDALTRLNHVVVALLHLFRSDRDLQPQAIDLTPLLARWPFEEMALTVDAQAGLQADPELLTAALLNLLDNSQRHGAHHVAISVRANGAEVLLRVEDDGSGIDPERLAALQRAIDQQDSSGPLGLGLTLAGMVARAHGGRLRLSADAQGTRIEMSFAAAAHPPAG